MDERVRRFAALFRGSPRAHGTYTVAGDATPGEKLEGRRWTVKEPAADALFARHLAGTYGLGAVPLLLDPPGMTRWGTIDVDDYSVDVAAFAKMVAARDLPLVPCRTKSGGVHLYLFLAEPTPAELVRRRLREWAGVVGYPDVEVFPKQDRLSDDPEAGDSYWGNWINLPYQGGDRSTRYALSEAGIALTVDEFLDHAEDYALGAAELADYEAAAPAEVAGLRGAPPCLARMVAGGVVAGGRNQALFHAALYWKRAEPDRCRERCDAFNRETLVPPTPPEEVQATVRAALKKDYGYRCNEQPMRALCDRAACEGAEFGVLYGRKRGADDLGLRFGQLVKIMTTPPVWRWEINDAWVEFDTATLANQKTFLLRVLEATNARSRPLKPAAWERLLDEAVAGSRIEVPPPDATVDGQLLYHLGKFCNGRAQARNLDELLLGKPFVDKDSGRACFVVSDLITYLTQQRVSGISQSFIYTRLRDRGLEQHVATLKGRETYYWSVPPLEAQTEPFETPREDVVPL